MSRPLILLVDDNKLFLELELDYLKDIDVTVRTARDGLAALDIMKAERPDLVFLDLHMPVMDGADCCAAIKADASLRSVPVVIVSSFDIDDDADRCRRAKCDEMLAKPVVRKTFVACCRKFLRSKFPVDERLPCLTQVVFWKANRCSYGMSRNIGPNGMFICFQGEIAEEERLRLNFVLPGNMEGFVDTHGRVAWVNRGKSPLNPLFPEGFGVEFEQLSDQNRQRIKEYLAVAQRDQ